MGIYNYGKIELGYFEESIGFIRQLDDKGIHPIPLTEEILAKCGFEWVDEIKGYADSLHCVIRGIDSYKFVPFCTRDKDCEIPIKFVHSLQNIYFCVTNKELCVDI